MSFTQLALHPSIQKAIEACGYTTPTPVQEKAIPVILEGKDLVASAQTGTGKTAAFVLPALNFLLNQKAIKKPRILILTPTRELAAQVTKSAGIYGKFAQFKIVSLVGGMPYYHQIKDLNRGADIIVATPGRLIDHVESERVDLSHIEMLILDEADRMLDMGFVDDVTKIAKLTPATRQTLLFSATIDKQLTAIIRHLMKDPVRINLSSEKLSAPKITQEVYKTKSMQHKTQLLKHFLTNRAIYKAIIFSATKMNADKLTKELRDNNFAAAALHGDLRQNVRNRTIDQFRLGKVQFLVATDVAARGIHVDDVTHVINYDLPKFAEDYVHRIGRTGRAGKEGIAISFVSSSDVQHLQRIERFIGEKLKLINNIDLSEREEMRPNRLITMDDMDLSPAKKERYFDNGRPKKRFGTNQGGRFSDERMDRKEEYRKRFLESDEAPAREERGEARKPFVKRDDRGECTPFAKRDGGFRKRSDDDRGERKPFVKREGGFSKRRDDSDGERRPFVKREGGFSKRRDDSDGERRPFAKREGGFSKRRDDSDGERRPFVKREGGFSKRRDDSDGERRPFVKREGGFSKRRDDDRGERKPFVKSEGGFRKRRDDSDGERKPFVKREGGFSKRRDDDRGERKSFGAKSGGKTWSSKKPASRKSRTVKGKNRGSEE